ncbi:MAG: NAD-dependent epimerase/dehydratase family protein [Acidimicrobiia bacterium]
MKVFVTGGAGFVGSHIIDRLLGSGDEIVVLDNLSSGRAENLAHHAGNDRLTIVTGSILDAPLVDELVERSDVVFHLAAAVGVKLINESPLESLTVNLRGSETVLRSAARRQTPLLLASTSEVYGKNDHVPLREDADRVLGSAWKSKWSYAEAKALDEFMAYCLWQTDGLPVATVRLFNTVGPRQRGRYGMVIPRFVEQALRGEDLTVYGDGQQSRCFGDVRDIAPAIIAIASAPEARGKAVNLGSAREITINDLAKLVIEVTGSSSGIAYVPYETAYRPGFEDVRRRVPDTSLARELIGFEPRISLEDTIASVAEERSAVLDARPVLSA